MDPSRPIHARTSRSVDLSRGNSLDTAMHQLNISANHASTSDSVGPSSSSNMSKRNSVQVFSPTLPAFAAQPSNEFYEIQEKTFRKWLNSKLESVGRQPMANLATDLSNGVNLIALMEIMSGESLGRYNTRPIMRVQKAENILLALNFIKSRGVVLTNIGSEDIIDGNLKLILGMIWTLEEGKSAKDGLLLWCQRQTQGYHEVDIKDFHRSFKDGLAFCALVHKHRPDLLNYDTLDKSNPYANTKLAFKVAEQALSIPQLLDVSDIVDASKPDERSVMTYVAELFLAFSDANKTQSAARRVAAFAANAQSIWTSKSEYEKRARALMELINNVLATWTNQKLGTNYQDAMQERSEFFHHKTSRREWTREKTAIETLFGNIVTKLKTYGMRAYTPPAGLTLSDIDMLWHKLLDAEKQRSFQINDNIRRIKDYLRQQFASAANQFAHNLAQISLELVEVDGPLKAQSEAVANLADKLSSLSEQLPTIKILEHACDKAKIEENDHTLFTFDDVQFEATLAKEAISKKQAFIQNQIVARQQTNLSPEQLEDFESIFRHFDSDHTNTLTLHELAAALPALGLNYSEAEVENIHMRLSNADGDVTFEKYLQFLVEITQDTFSPSQIRQAFASLAGDKGYLVPRDLQITELPQDSQQFLLRTMGQSTSNGHLDSNESEPLDYQRYIGHLFEEK